MHTKTGRKAALDTRKEATPGASNICIWTRCFHTNHLNRKTAVESTRLNMQRWESKTNTSSLSLTLPAPGWPSPELSLIQVHTVRPRSLSIVGHVDIKYTALSSCLEPLYHLPRAFACGYVEPHRSAQPPDGTEYELNLQSLFLILRYTAGNRSTRIERFILSGLIRNGVLGWAISYSIQWMIVTSCRCFGFSVSLEISCCVRSRDPCKIRVTTGVVWCWLTY